MDIEIISIREYNWSARQILEYVWVKQLQDVRRHHNGGDFQQRRAAAPRHPASRSECADVPPEGAGYPVRPARQPRDIVGRAGTHHRVYGDGVTDTAEDTDEQSTEEEEEEGVG